MTSGRYVSMSSRLFRLVGKIIDNLPGQRLGVYLPVPYFFLVGVAFEYFMINVNINGVNFYEVVKKKNLEYYEKERKRKEFEQSVLGKLNSKQ